MEVFTTKGFVMIVVLLLIGGCASQPKPQIQIQIRGEVEKNPEYNITISL